MASPFSIQHNLSRPSSVSITATRVSTLPPQDSLSSSCPGPGPSPSTDSATGTGGGGAASTTAMSQSSRGAAQRQRPLPPPAAAATTPASALPTAMQQVQIAQARTALVASLGNALDTELQTRGAVLHGNAAAIARQTREVEGVLAGLRREDEKLLKVLKEGGRQVKELGDVQNWAERLERDFLVLEETLRLVEKGCRSESGSWEGSGAESWEGSVDGEGDVGMNEDNGNDGRSDRSSHRVDKGQGKQVGTGFSDAMDVDPAQVTLSPDVNIQQPGSGPSSSVNQMQPNNPRSKATVLSPRISWFNRFVWKTS